MRYRVYHDESQEAGYWHGMLLIPEENRGQILLWLQEIRDYLRYYKPLMLKGLNGHGPKFHCIRMWLELGVNGMAQDLRSKGALTVVIKQRRRDTAYHRFITLNKPQKLKFILFKVRDNHKSMGQFFSDYPSKVETTFRMGLKGGLHLLFNDTNPVEIGSIHFDGHRHHGRNIDKARIIYRLESELRSYCTFSDDVYIDDRSSDDRRNDSQEYDDCQFLQLTDLLVGGFRTYLGETKNKFQREATYPVELLISKWIERRSVLKNSRWDKGYNISECYLENGDWKFNKYLVPKKIQKNQFTLF